MFADDTAPPTDESAAPPAPEPVAPPAPAPPAVESPAVVEPAPIAQPSPYSGPAPETIRVPEPEPPIEEIHSAGNEPTIYIRRATEEYPVPEGARRYTCPKCDAVHAVWTDQPGRAGTLQFAFECKAGCGHKTALGLG